MGIRRARSHRIAGSNAPALVRARAGTRARARAASARRARAIETVRVGRVERRRRLAGECGGGATREISVRGVAGGEFRRERARRGDSCRGFGIVR